MANEDLFQAFQMFQKGVQEAAVSGAVNEATAAMQQIKQSNMDQMQQRQALQGLSNEVALRLAGVGAPASTIQSAFQAIAPQNFGSAEQMQLEGALSGDQQLQQAASGIIGERRQAARSQAAFENQLAMQREEASDFRRMKLDALKSSMKRGPEPKVFGLERVDSEVELTPKEVADLRGSMANLANIGKGVKALDDLVSQHGTVQFDIPGGARASSKMETAFGSLLMAVKDQGLYNLGVLQKIDVEALEKIIPNPSSFITEGTYRSKMDQFKRELANRIKINAAQRGFKVTPKLISSLDLQKQFGELPGSTLKQMDPETKARYETAKEFADTDPQAKADLDQIMEIYGGE